MARTPLYKTAETKMITRIAKGTWEVGRRLPNEFELAEEFGVSQGTMRRALISLESAGYLSRKPGRGTLVAANAPVVAPEITLRPAVLDGSGAALVLEPFRGRKDTRAASSREIDVLGKTRVATLERTLKHAGARAALEEVVVPVAILEALAEDAPADLAAHLSNAGLAPARLTAVATAEVTDMAQSVALSADRHTALLCIRTTAFDATGSVLAIQVLRIAVPGAQLVHR